MSTDSPWQQLDVRDTGDRVDITIDRADRRNSLDFDTWDELARVMAQVAERDEVRVVTLTGAGDSFCAGVDFEWIEKSTQIERSEYPSFIRRWAGVADAFERVAQPTLAVINGAAVGGGCELAMACDLRIASDRAVFAMPQMRMGVIPDVGGTSRLAKAAGSALAKDMILTGRVLNAEDALRFGLVSRVVPHDELAGVADGMASAIADLPWPSAYFASFAIDVGAHLDARRAADLEAITDQVMFREPEVNRRINAFMTSKGLKGMDRKE